MQRGCQGPAVSSGQPVGHPSVQIRLSTLQRTMVAPLPSSTFPCTSGRVFAQDSCHPSSKHHAASLHKPGHDRTAVVVFAAAQRATAKAASSLQVSKPAQFILLSECGSAPSAADVQEVLPYLTPTQLADAVWCFAQHEVKPTPELMAAVAQEIHSKLPHFRAPDLSNTLWAFAMLKYQPSEQWWQDFERQVFGALTDLSDRQVANLMWAFAVLERRPSQASRLGTSSAPTENGTVPSLASASRPGWVLDPLLSHSCASGFSGYSPRSLHLLVWSLGQLHHMPPGAWLQGFLSAAELAFFRFTPTELANIVWALAKLGVELPAAWLDKLLLVAQWRFPSFSARLLSIVAWSTATLNHRPQQEWLLCFEEQVRTKFLEFSGHELACVAWSLRRFGYSTADNAVFYMLQNQKDFLAADFEILSNPTLLRQVLGSKAMAKVEGSEEAEGGSGGSGGSCSSI